MSLSLLELLSAQHDVNRKSPYWEEHEKIVVSVVICALLPRDKINRHFCEWSSSVSKLKNAGWRAISAGKSALLFQKRGLRQDQHCSSPLHVTPVPEALLLPSVGFRLARGTLSYMQARHPRTPSSKFLQRKTAHSCCLQERSLRTPGRSPRHCL